MGAAVTRQQFMADPRRKEFASAYEALLAGERGARERYGLATGRFVEAYAEYVPSPLRLASMRSLFTELRIPLSAIFVGFGATEDESDDLMESLPRLVDEPPDQVAVLRAMPYRDYLQTGHWMRVRSASLRRYEYRCALCFSPRQLEVHHRTYERLGCERDADVTVLCSNCHSRHHEAKAA